MSDLDRLIERAFGGDFDGEPMKHTKLFHALVDHGMGAHVLRFQTALYQGKLVEELLTYMMEVEAGRP